MDPDRLAMPGARRRTLIALVAALAAGEVELDAGVDWNRARAQLLALPGIGPWTAEVVAMRGLGDPDAFPVTDLGVRAAAASVGLSTAAAALTAHSTRWRPWRAYATQHLWTALDHAVNDWPPTENQQEKR
jgi:AraC family transcriptional regulator of adaptative response / DNA-3-methyladenine glycosylase II